MMTRRSTKWLGGAICLIAVNTTAGCQTAHLGLRTTPLDVPELAMSVRPMSLTRSSGPYAPPESHTDKVLEFRRSLRRAGLAPRVRWRNVNLVVSIAERTLIALVGNDTVFAAPVGVAHGLSLAYGGRRWRFETPKGGRRVLRKVVDPVWTPPDWHYAEAALSNGLRLATVPPQGVRLENGSRLVVRNGRVGLFAPGLGFGVFPTDEHVVLGDRLFIPPVGTKNRKVSGVLGSVALDLGGGYLIHGTTNETSVGQASSHGCLRMHEEDLAWLYDHVPVGARVMIR